MKSAVGRFTPTTSGRVRLIARCFVRQSEGKLGILELASGAECRLLHFDEMAASEPRHCSFSPDGQALVSAHRAGVLFWDVGRGDPIDFHSMGDTRTAVFHPSGTSLITNGRDGLRRWPIEFSPGGPGKNLTDRDALNAVDVGIRLALTLQRLYPNEFALTKVQTLLQHQPTLDAIKAGKSLSEIKQLWTSDLEEFKKRREKFSVYK